MSKWFEPLPLSPPSETHTPASSISTNRPWAASPFVCLSPAVGQWETLTPRRARRAMSRSST